jgi:hypothetical protein
MTKEEYFLTEWTSNLDMRAVDKDGQEFYYQSEPVVYGDSSGWGQDSEKGVKYADAQVSDWWRQSLQSYDQCIELTFKNQNND